MPHLRLLVLQHYWVFCMCTSIADSQFVGGDSSVELVTQDVTLWESIGFEASLKRSVTIHSYTPFQDSLRLSWHSERGSDLRKN